MQIHLAITPKEAQQLPSCPLPLVHIAYAIDEIGMLSRSALPAQTQGGLMGLSDRCRKPLKNADILLRFDSVFHCPAQFPLGYMSERLTALQILSLPIFPTASCFLTAWVSFWHSSIERSSYRSFCPLSRQLFSSAPPFPAAHCRKCCKTHKTATAQRALRLI